jgi:hypothetical protein
MEPSAVSSEAPDLIEPVLGFRQWRLDGGGLRSLHVDQRWTARTLDAACRARSHPGRPAPAAGCSCGIHAWYRRVPRLASAATADLVSGAVVLWGAIELHHDGMRAEHAEVVALALPAAPGRKRRRLVEVADALGVPAVPYRTVPAVGRHRGRPVPEDLRPAAAYRPRAGARPNVFSRTATAVSALSAKRPSTPSS